MHHDMQFLDMNYDLVNQSICHFHPLFNYAFSHPKIAAIVEAGHFPLFGPRTYICNFTKRHYTFSCQEKCNCGYEKYHTEDEETLFHARVLSVWASTQSGFRQVCQIIQNISFVNIKSSLNVTELQPEIIQEF